MIDVAKGGQWLKLALSDGRTGWVTSRYVSSPTMSAPSLETSPAVPRPQRIEEGIVERVADGDTITVITAHQTKLRIRMVGIFARVSHSPHLLGKSISRCCSIAYRPCTF